MKSILGLVSALAAGVAFAAAEYYAVRPGAGWLDMQGVFIVALPYNWTMLRLAGASNFTPDSAGEVAAAALFDVALAFLAGALVEAAARAGWRALKRLRGRA